MKMLAIMFLIVFVIILSIVLLVAILFYKELLTLKTLKKRSEYPFYELDYRSDYKLDAFLKKGASNDDEFKTSVSRILLKGLPITAHPEGACSTFAATTTDGDYLLGRNFDYKPSVILVVRTAPPNGYRSISLVDLCHIGYNAQKLPDSSFLNKINILAAPYMCLDGINEMGFAIGVLTAREQVTHQNSGKIPVMTTAAIRMLLDKAASVDEALKLLASYDMNSSGKIGYHFQLADSNGDTAIVEYLENKMVILRRDTTHPYLAATNFTLSTAERDGIGQERYEIIMNALKQSKAVLSEQEAMDVLRAAYLDGTILYPDPSHMYHNSRTQWSAVYNLSKRSIQVCIGNDYEKVYNYSFDI